MRTANEQVTVQDSELPVDIQHDVVDDWPFVWHNFSRQGYVTLLSEEQPGIFTYKATGFVRPPTDVYLRPFGSMMVMRVCHAMGVQCRSTWTCTASARPTASAINPRPCAYSKPSNGSCKCTAVDHISCSRSCGNSRTT